MWTKKNTVHSNNPVAAPLQHQISLGLVQGVLIHHWVELVQSPYGVTNGIAFSWGISPICHIPVTYYRDSCLNPG